jgi:hypothetical protein
MSIKASLKEELLADEAVAAIVVHRVYAAYRPAGTGLPALTIRRARRTRLSDLEGYIGRDESLIQIDCWAESPDAADNLADAVVDCLECFEQGGTMGTDTQTTIETAQHVTDQDSVLPPVSGSELAGHAIPVQFLITHQ